MSDDIVKRLRCRDAYLSLDEAADEIESLRGRLADSLKAEEYSGLQWDKAERVLGEAEALLREAREPIFDYSQSVAHAGDEDEIGVRTCCRVLSYKAHEPRCAALLALTRIDAHLSREEPDDNVLSLAEEKERDIHLSRERT